MRLRRAKRPAARLLVTDPAGQLLLFRFTPTDRAPFWCTPGGALDPGESFEAAARRELIEETGFDRDPGPCVAVRHVTFITLEGIEVDAEERYFAVRVDGTSIDTTGHTALERRVMQSHRWWTPPALAALDEAYFPVDLIDLWQELAQGRLPA
ncbi:MAG TPA: NUDIX domain-containing protein [Sphingobium sp.]|nr:NUDIX domain-containing protein [Sphingobium sp.]